MNTGIIVLAAGSSSRLGQPKQMLDINGEPLLLKTAKAAINSSVGPVVVVLGSNGAAHQRLISTLPIEVVNHDSWKNGMGSSLKAGLRHLIIRHPSLQAIIVMVCDQPMVTDGILKHLVDRHLEASKPIVASFYSGLPGVPALFDKAYFSRLMALPDDQGAKNLILENPQDVTEVAFSGGEIDIDTMDDYKAFENGKK